MSDELMSKAQARKLLSATLPGSQLPTPLPPYAHFQ